MANRVEAEKMRTLFVRKVHEGKDVLFGKFTNKLTGPMKKEKWEELLQYGRKIGINTLNGKDTEYVRKIYWQNIRRATLAKHRPKPTGESPDPNYDWNEVSFIYYYCFKIGKTLRNWSPPPKFQIFLRAPKKFPNI